MDRCDSADLDEIEDLADNLAEVAGEWAGLGDGSRKPQLWMDTSIS